MKATLSYTGLRVKDLAKSVDFYTRVLGMTESARWKVAETHGEVVQLTSEKGGPTLELDFYEKGTPYDTKYVPGDGLDHLAFQVPDLDTFLTAARAAGFPERLEVKSGTSRWAYIEDPNGLWIEVFA